MSYKYECPNCEEIMSKLESSSDPSGCNRPDYYCCCCNIRYGMSASGFYVVATCRDATEISIENRELKTTIKTMMKLKEESA